MQAGKHPLRADCIGLGQLRLFESVGRLENIRRAAEECNLSQPAVTQSIAKLESQVGLTLLHRGTNGSYLTELGNILHRRILRFFDQIEKAIAELAGLDRKPVQTIARRLTRAQIRSGLLLVTDPILFAEAAQSYGLSAASLQRASHDLERNVGRQLYRRSAAGITGTPDGIEFGRKIKLAMQEIEFGLGEINAAQGMSQTKIVIYVMPGGGSVLLGSMINEFVTSYPEACVRVVTSTSATLLKNLLFGDADLAIGLIPDKLHDELYAKPLASTPYEIVGRRGHPLHQKGVVTVDDLAACGWIAATASSSRRAVFNLLFKDHTGPRTIETSSMPVIRGLLSASDRLMLMTSYERIYHGDMLVPIPFALSGPVPAVGLLMRRAWLPTSLHLSFMQLLQRHAAGAHVPRIVAQTG